MSRKRSQRSNEAAGAPPGRDPRDETTSVLPVRKQRVFALPCEKMPAHGNTRVYRTDGQTRYCVCDDCGHTWKQIGPVAGENPVDGELDPAPEQPGDEKPAGAPDPEAELALDGE